jgi:signal transduction histidine kinase
MSAGAAGRSVRDCRAPLQGAGAAELISRLGHALRTPLNSILGNTQILGLDRVQPPTPAQQQRLDQIQAAGWQLLRMIDDALELARIAAGQVRISMEPVALLPLLHDSLAQLGGQDGSSLVRLEADAGTDATVWADPGRLRQVVVRLLLGAIQCDRHGSGIQIGVARDAQGGASIRIRGEGLALAPGHLEKLFLPFDHPAAEHAPGPAMQVGLALAQKLLELMDGRLQVQHEASSGAELHILLRSPAAHGGPALAAGAA